jgi:hypothetical protein
MASTDPDRANEMVGAALVDDDSPPPPPPPPQATSKQRLPAMTQRRGQRMMLLDKELKISKVMGVIHKMTGC